jgi:hypothetical protein
VARRAAATSTTTSPSDVTRMTRAQRARVVSGILAMLACAGANAQIFVGITPCADPIREFLRISAKTDCEIVRWDLWPGLGANGHPDRLHVTAEYGLEGQPLKRIERDGKWAVDQGTPEHPDSAVLWLELKGRELLLWRAGPHTVHFLDADRNLLVGNSRRGYTLATAFSGKPRPGPAPALTFTPLPLTDGPTVFGTFEGRTPCGLSQVLGISVPAACDKLDWRVTLFQDPQTLALTNYRLEGSLFQAAPREGAISHQVSTAFNRDASVLRLAGAPGEQPVYLMRGDDNVFFFVDRSGDLGVGDRESGYVLYRLGPPVRRRPGNSDASEVAAVKLPTTEVSR